MTRRSGYDESNSPQWRYFLSRESEIKRQRLPHRDGMSGMSALEEAENLFQHDGREVKRNRKNKKERQARRKETPKDSLSTPQKFTKKGKEILYSASPGRPPRKMNTTITTDNDKN